MKRSPAPIPEWKKAVIAYNLAHGHRILLVDVTSDEARRIVMDVCCEYMHPYGLCFACPARATE